MKIARLLITAPAAAAGLAAAVHGLRRTVRSAVAAEFAAEHAREAAEAQAFWAERERQDAEDEAAALREAAARQAALREAAFAELPEPREAAEAAQQLLGSDFDADLDPEFAAALRSALEDMAAQDGGGASGGPAAGGPGFPAQGASGSADAEPESDAGGVPGQPDPNRYAETARLLPDVPDSAWTEQRLGELCDEGVLLSDVRPGPLGTLDLYVFADATTLCVIPGDRSVTRRLIGALRHGEEVRLLGGSLLAGSFALTFSIGADGDTAYLLADRVVASL